MLQKYIQIKYFLFPKNKYRAVLSLSLPKNKALRSHNHNPKVKNDSCSTYAKVQYIVSIGQLVKQKWIFQDKIFTKKKSEPDNGSVLKYAKPVSLLLRLIDLW